jgi:hypothetical protein
MTPFLSADALLDYDVSEALDGRPAMPQPSGGYLNDVAVFGNARLVSTDIAEKSLIRLACTFAEKAGHVVRTVKRHEREVPCARGPGPLSWRLGAVALAVWSRGRCGCF